MITLLDIKKSFGTSEKNIAVLRNITMTVKDGDMVALIGHSGAGKSTLLHIIAGFIRPDSGKYLYCKKNTASFDQNQWSEFRNREIGYVLQNNGLLFDRDVLHNIMLPLETKHIPYGKRIERAKEVSELVEIENKLHMNPSRLSGGEQQRVAIARALVTDPPVILADEPTGSLDADSERNILSIFSKLNQEGKTIILVTHEINVAQACHSVLEIKNGVIENK